MKSSKFASTIYEVVVVVDTEAELEACSTGRIGRTETTFSLSEVILVNAGVVTKAKRGAGDVAMELGRVEASFDSDCEPGTGMVS